MDSKILLGIIAVTILGTMSVQHILVQAGLAPIETISVTGISIGVGPWDDAVTEAQCPSSHPFLIGGTYSINVDESSRHVVITFYNTTNNKYQVTVGVHPSSTGSIAVEPKALCAKFNFPMGAGAMIGGELLDINTVSLLVGAIGTNPVITALVGITLAGVAGQAAWFIYKKKNSNKS